MNTTITINLHIGERELELRIPNQVTLMRLNALVAPILQDERLIQSDDFELILANKKVMVAGEPSLASYSLSDGDHLVVSVH